MEEWLVGGSAARHFGFTSSLRSCGAEKVKMNFIRIHEGRLYYTTLALNGRGHVTDVFETLISSDKKVNVGATCAQCPPRPRHEVPRPRPHRRQRVRQEPQVQPASPSH